MSESLKTYLIDHHAGSLFGLELAESLEHRHSGNAFGKFAGQLRSELEEDRATLQAIIENLDASPPVLKNAAAWISEKAAELKFAGGPLGTLEAVEVLALGIVGKLKLWEVLSNISAADQRLKPFDFNELKRRARSQHDRLEPYRVQAAEEAFATA